MIDKNKLISKFKKNFFLFFNTSMAVNSYWKRSVYSILSKTMELLVYIKLEPRWSDMKIPNQFTFYFSNTTKWHMSEWCSTRCLITAWVKTQMIPNHRMWNRTLNQWIKYLRFCATLKRRKYISGGKNEKTKESALRISFDKEQLLLSLFKKNELDADDRTIGQIWSTIKDQNGSSSLSELLDCKDIEKKYVAIFPLRGIGIVQWTKSNKIPDRGNYEKACERVEILSHLLSKKEREKINETKEKEMFDFITHPHVFTFTKENEQIWVERTGKTKPNKFHLLKTSEEVMEAKIASLLWHIRILRQYALRIRTEKCIQTWSNAWTVLYINGFDKTKIVSKHSPNFVDTITIRNTHVFLKEILLQSLMFVLLQMLEKVMISHMWTALIVWEACFLLQRYC